MEPQSAQRNTLCSPKEFSPEPEGVVLGLLLSYIFKSNLL